MWQVDVEQTVWNFGVLEVSLEDKLTQYKVTKISYSLSPALIISFPPSLYPLSLSLLHSSIHDEFNSSLIGSVWLSTTAYALVHDLHTVCLRQSQLFFIIVVGIFYFRPSLKPGFRSKTWLCRKHVKWGESGQLQTVFSTLCRNAAAARMLLLSNQRFTRTCSWLCKSSLFLSVFLDSSSFVSTLWSFHWGLFSRSALQHVLMWMTTVGQI